MAIIMAKEGSAVQKVIYRFIYPSCLYYSLTVFLSTAAAFVVSRDQNAYSVQTLLWMWVFSLGMAGLNQLFHIKALPRALALMLHWIGAMGLFMLLFVAVSGQTENIAGAVILLVFLTAAYFILAGLYCLFQRLLSEKAIRRVVYPMAMYYSAAIFILEILCYSLEVAAGAPNFINLCYLWIFAAAMTLLELVLRSNIGVFFRVIIHFLGFMLSFIIVFFVLAHNYVDYADAFLPCIITAAIYFFIVSAALLIKGNIEKKENKGKKYKRQFNG